jgi:glycosyltransferase involved in cell wall biosynthesis
MDSRFGVGPKLHVITNGYDPEEFTEVKPHEFGHFAIVYAGTFYPPKRVISPVMAALSKLKAMPNENGNWFFHYYGNQPDHVLDEAKRYGVEHLVVIHGQVLRSDVLSAVRGAGVAVVITSVAENGTLEDQGIVPGKLFENIGLGTPVLLIAPPGSDSDAILTATGAGRRFSGSDISGIASFFKDAMQGQISEADGRGVYTWANIVLQLDRVLREALNYRHRPFPLCG